MADRTEQVTAVLALVEDGMSETKACEQVGINRATFRNAALKVLSDNEYAKSLALLAEDQVERAEQTIQDMRNGVIDAQMARVELDARKWFASKLLPRKYGEKLTQEVHGKDGGPIEVASLSEDQIKARLVALGTQFPDIKKALTE